jgi:hypothetical protein
MRGFLVVCQVCGWIDTIPFTAEDYSAIYARDKGSELAAKHKRDHQASGESSDCQVMLAEITYSY